ncbi:hypothetical protein PRO82_001457 [Candidatus Protochlamydia amoebophila]|nr:hypothetical protein [Candidatus Protochlamydia amoebophila]
MTFTSKNLKISAKICELTLNNEFSFLLIHLFNFINFLKKN